MSSSDQEAPELKGGHPPAVKVGGMRVVQSKLVSQSSENKSSSSAESPKAKGPEEAEEGSAPAGAAGAEEETGQEEEEIKKDRISVSGAPARGNLDFPPEAVKAFHEKASRNQACHEKPLLSNNPKGAANLSHASLHQPRSANH